MVATLARGECCVREVEARDLVKFELLRLCLARGYFLLTGALHSLVDVLMHRGRPLLLEGCLAPRQYRSSVHFRAECRGEGTSRGWFTRAGTFDGLIFAFR